MAGGAALVEGGAGDVEVGPGDQLAVGVLGELLQEQARGEGAAHAVALVGDVGGGGVEAGAQGRRERERPARLVGAVGGLGDRRAQLLVVAHDTEDVRAEGDDAGSGEGGDVEDLVGAGLGGQGHAVGEDHAALGVGVEDLDGHAVAHGDDVTGALCVAAGHVLGEAEVAGDRDVELELGGGDDGRGHGGGAGHVGLHRRHAGGGLDAHAAGVEGDALADERDVRLLAARAVGEGDDARRAAAALADADDAAEAALEQGLVVEHLDLELAGGGLGHLLHLLGEGLRVEQVGRGVDEVAGPGDVARDGRGRLEDLLGGGLAVERGEDGDLPLLLLARRGLVRGEGVVTGQRALADGGQVGVVVVGEGDGDGALARGADGRAGGTTKGVGPPFALLLAQTDEHDLGGLEAGDRGDRGGGADRGAHLESRQDRLQVRCGGLRQVRARDGGRLRAGDTQDEGAAGPGGEGTGTEDQRGHVKGTFRAGGRWMYHGQAIPDAETVASGS